jgi:hypothetical protein
MRDCKRQLFLKNPRISVIMLKGMSRKATCLDTYDHLNNEYFRANFRIISAKRWFSSFQFLSDFLYTGFFKKY